MTLNLLYLSHRIPYPPNKGDKIRSFHQVRHLSRDNKVFLGTLADDKDMRYVNELQTMCSGAKVVPTRSRWGALTTGLAKNNSFSVCHFYHPELQAFVDNVLQNERIDAIICYCSPMAEYIYKSAVLKNMPRRPRLLMDFVDLDSAKWRQYAKIAGFPLNFVYKAEHNRLSRYELQILQTFDKCFFSSSREVELLAQTGVDASATQVVENGIDTAFYTTNNNHNGKPGTELLFTGVMDYQANVDAVLWFCHKILPQIRHLYSDVKFKITGMNPVMAVRKLHDSEDITVTGYVDDIRSYYHQADVYVAPLRVARGVQNKILEAMASGVPVVATSQACGGIRCRDGVDILIADSEAAFAQQVIRLLTDSNLRQEISRNALANIRKHYDWETNLRALDRFLAE
jgi:sugar transferase (PEP-CTERM/EpsH1 system associated)